MGSFLIINYSLTLFACFFVTIAHYLVYDSLEASFLFIMFGLFGLFGGVLIQMIKIKDVFVRYFYFYSLYSLIALLFSFYSFETFNVWQSTGDAINLFSYISTDGELPDILDIRMNSPLSIYIWSFFYNIVEYINFEANFLFVILLNSALISLSACLISAVCEGLSKDSKVFSLFVISFCGFFWLYSSVAIRDSFVIFLISLFIWRTYLYFSLKSGSANYIIVGLFLSLVLFFVREASGLVLSVFIIVASLCKMSISDNGIVNINKIYLASCFLIFIAYFSGFFDSVIAMMDYSNQAYHSMSIDRSSASSLGMMISNFPFPFNFIFGSIFIIVYPIPLWFGLSFGTPEYSILISISGIWTSILFPFFLYGLYSIYYTSNINKPFVYCLYIFYFFYMVVTLTTSGEIRHFSQSVPIFIILVSCYDGWNKNFKRSVFYSIFLLWLLFVFFIHFLWSVLKAF